MPGYSARSSDSAAWGGNKLTKLGSQFLMLIAIILFTIPTYSAPKKKIAAELEASDPNAVVDVIVHYNSAPDSKKAAKVKQNHGQEKRRFPLINSSVVAIPAKDLAGLAADDEVEYIAPDREVAVTADSIAAQTVNAASAWSSGWTGAGVGIVVIDSGIATSNQDLQSKVSYSYSWVPGGTTDQYGHGTFVAGLIAGMAANSNGRGYLYRYSGIAPGATLFNARVLDKDGHGKDSDVIAAIQLAIQYKSALNIRIINLSLGRPVYESYQDDPLCQAVEAAWKSGIVVVVAAGNFGRNNDAGNQGYGTITSPGNDPYVITVGAMKDNGTAYKSDDTIASYSSKGPTLFDHIVKPDLVAPGNRVIATELPGSTLQSYPETNVTYSEYMIWGGKAVSPYYMRLSGTSMAAPLVSGAAALLLQKNPWMTPDQVKVRLMETASKTFPAQSTVVDPVTGATFSSQYDVFTVGAGYLDIQAALSSTRIWQGNAVSPTAVWDATTGTARMVGDPSSVFGSSVIWGNSPVSANSVIWGNYAVDANSTIWGNSVIWGNQSLDAFSVIWGNYGSLDATSVIWGNYGTLDGTSVIWGNRNTEAMSTTIAGEE